MSKIKDTLKKLLAEELIRLAPQADPADCAVCLEMAALKRTGHRHWIKRDKHNENPSPVFNKLKILLHFGDGSDYQVRICPNCGQFYYYCFKGMTYQISYSSNDYDEFNPAEEWCIPGTADAVLECVFDNYAIKISRFKRVVRKKDYWLVT